MNENLSAKYWDNRYLNDDFGWDLGQISPPLKAYFDQLTNKKLFILIPGAGNSYEAEYLVNNGFENVYVCDFAEQPLKNLLKRCPKIKEEHLLLSDFFEITNLKFDLIIEQTFFCAISKSLRKKYFNKVHELLNPAGKLVGLLFNDVLNEDKPPFGGTKEEYFEYFKTLFKPIVYETAYNSIKPREGREIFINLEKV
ncbi:MAG: SAM-dependent methyltransferase [Bacteroidota bacterium]|nr:SAM-dependent methyltransferase [Bacteroidota bacterium]MDP3145172.1 SAM-dependent methyltransferase [Bacteroidota bacterium]MDP3557302.1 SAM-dependent methyltransferase [Bacteroidota bacterium]